MRRNRVDTGVCLACGLMLVVVLAAAAAVEATVSSGELCSLLAGVSGPVMVAQMLSDGSGPGALVAGVAVGAPRMISDGDLVVCPEGMLLSERLANVTSSAVELVARLDELDKLVADEEARVDRDQRLATAALCALGVCRNGGSCAAGTPTRVVCVCTAAFTGSRCETALGGGP
jgi:hypothetical protein